MLGVTHVERRSTPFVLKKEKLAIANFGQTLVKKIRS
jgi:hypothetical protein